MVSGFNYPDGNPIQNGDMFIFKDGTVGFVFLDDRVDLWSVKSYNNVEKKPVIMSLQNAIEYIDHFLV